MHLKTRLSRLEKGNRADGKEELRMRTPETRQLDMELWLHIEEIRHGEIDRDRALARARELHEKPMIVSPCPPMPAEVRTDLRQYSEDIESERAALPAEERAMIEQDALQRGVQAKTLLDEAAGLIAA
ncbi:MAG: hypothetical protein AAGA21_16355 [Pseudomonadota bacterium]